MTKDIELLRECRVRGIRSMVGFDFLGEGSD